MKFCNTVFINSSSLPKRRIYETLYNLWMKFNIMSNVFQCILFSVLTLLLLWVKDQKISNNPLLKKTTMDKKPESLSKCFCLVTKQSILLIKIYIATIIAWIRVFISRCQVKNLAILFVCFISLFLHALHCGWCILWFRSLHHRVTALPLWFTQNFSSVGLSTFTHSKWVKFSSFNLFCQSVFTTLE